MNISFELNGVVTRGISNISQLRTAIKYEQCRQKNLEYNNIKVRKGRMEYLPKLGCSVRDHSPTKSINMRLCHLAGLAFTIAGVITLLAGHQTSGLVLIAAAWIVVIAGQHVYGVK
jgi:hypothetical protein